MKNPDVLTKALGLLLSLSLICSVSISPVLASSPLDGFKDLSHSELEYLKERDGIDSLEDIKEREELQKAFLDTLVDNLTKVDEGEEDKFLIRYYDLEQPPPSIKNLMDRAIKVFRDLPEVTFERSDLTQEEHDYLHSREGKLFVDDIKNLEQLEERFVDILGLHSDKFNKYDRASVDRYLVENYDLTGNIPTSIFELKGRAVERFLEERSTELDARFDTEQLRYLRSRKSITPLENVKTLRDLEELFLKTLELNLHAFNQHDEEAVRMYLRQHFDLDDVTPDYVNDRLRVALDQFLSTVPEEAFGLRASELKYLNERPTLVGIDSMDNLEDRYFLALRNNLESFSRIDKSSAESFLDETFEHDNLSELPQGVQLRRQRAADRFVRFFGGGGTAATTVGGNLNQSELDFLLNRNGLILLDDVKTKEQLKARFIEALKAHQDELEPGEERAFLSKYFDLSLSLPTGIKRVLKEALTDYRQADSDEEICQRCQSLQEMLRKLYQRWKSYDLKRQEVAQQLQELRQELHGELDEIISQARCAVGRDVRSGDNTVSGKIYGRKFTCAATDDVRQMSANLQEFWRIYEASPRSRKMAELQEELAEINEQAGEIPDELRRIKKNLDDCQRRAQENQCSPLSTLESEVLEAIPQAGASEAYQIVTRESLVEPLESVNNSRLVNLSEKYRAVERGNFDIGRFRDLNDKPDHVRDAINDLTNRVPLFKGNEGGRDFGANEAVQRAVVAEVLKRLGQMGALEGYVNVPVDYGYALNDIPGGIWFEESMRIAVQNGVFKPKNDNVRPGDPLNWAEMATVIRRWANLEPIVPEGAPLPGIDPKKWFAQEFYALERAGILDDFGYIDPGSLPTKADLALVVRRLLQQAGIFVE